MYEIPITLHPRADMIDGKAAHGNGGLSILQLMSLRECYVGLLLSTVQSNYLRITAQSWAVE